MRRLVALLLLLLATPAVADAAQPLRLNDVQARGTHNSYHRDPGHPVGPAVGWNYSHPTLDRQLEDQQVRQFELDVHYNPYRGRLEVYHVWFGDDRTTCETLQACLATIRGWSDAHPDHAPIMVMIEPKDEGPPKNAGLPEDGDPFTEPFDAAAYDLLDRELRQGFGADRTLEPADVTLPGRTLRESILSKGWPTIDSLRGQVLFVIDGDTHATPYSAGFTSLQQRAAFVQAEPDQPVAAFVGRDGARLPGEGKYDRMRRVVAQGFMVRDYVSPGGFEASKAGGAHFISSDDPEDLVLSADPQAPSRCNPISAPGSCADRAIEVHEGGDWTSPHPEPDDGPAAVAQEKARRIGCGSAGSALGLAGAPDPGCPLP